MGRVRLVFTGACLSQTLRNNSFHFFPHVIGVVQFFNIVPRLRRNIITEIIAVEVFKLSIADQIDSFRNRRD